MADTIGSRRRVELSGHGLLTLLVDGVPVARAVQKKPMYKMAAEYAGGGPFVGPTGRVITYDPKTLEVTDLRTGQVSVLVPRGPFAGGQRMEAVA